MCVACDFFSLYSRAISCDYNTQPELSIGLWLFLMEVSTEKFGDRNPILFDSLINLSQGMIVSTIIVRYLYLYLYLYLVLSW